MLTFEFIHVTKELKNSGLLSTSLASVRLNNIVMAACTGLEYGGGLLLLVLSPRVLGGFL